MTTTTLTKTARALITSQTKTAASNGTPTRSAPVDLRTAQGGILTMKITNGATGPTTACEGRVLIAHDDGVSPAPGSAGAVWKTAWKFNGGLSASTIVECTPYVVDPAVMHLLVEFDGNTGADVTIEAYFSEITSIESA